MFFFSIFHFSLDLFFIRVIFWFSDSWILSQYSKYFDLCHMSLYIYKCTYLLLPNLRRCMLMCLNARVTCVGTHWNWIFELYCNMHRIWFFSSEFFSYFTFPGLNSAHSSERNTKSVYSVQSIKYDFTGNTTSWQSSKSITKSIRGEFFWSR